VSSEKRLRYRMRAGTRPAHPRAAGDAPQPHDLQEVGSVLSSGESSQAGQVQQADGTRFAAELAGLASLIQRESADQADILAAVAEAAAKLIPGADCAALVIPAQGGRLRALAASGEAARALPDLEHETGQGPCTDAVRETSTVLVPDIVAVSRWPAFRERAAALGIAGVACAPIAASAAHGSLVLTSASAGTLSPESERLAAALAAHVSIALAAAESRRQLSVALTNRDLIGQAKGILMERHRLTSDAAFSVLARASQETNTKLRDVAGELCRTGALPVPARPRPSRDAKAQARSLQSR
jgi:GAF domain-containing protein